MIPRVLLVVHDFLPEAVAGTEILVARLASALATRTQVAVFCTVRAHHLPQNHLARDSVDGVDVFRMVQNYPHRPLNESLHDPAGERVFSRVLGLFQPDIVHFHHLAFLPLTLPAIAAARGAKIAFTLHDYFLECPSGGRLTAHPDGAWCASPPPERCAACHARYRHREGGLEQLALTLSALPGLPVGWPFRLFRRLPARLQHIVRRFNPPPRTNEGTEAVQNVIERRTIVDQLIDKVDVFIAPSQHIAAWARDLGVHGRLEVVPNPGPEYDRASPLPAAPPVKLVFVGTPAPHKGLLRIVRAVSRFTPDQARLEVCGDLDVFPAYTHEVQRAAGRNVQFLGRCPPEKVCDALARTHLLVMGSTWPENAPLTILEAQAAGRPVVAPRAGGIPEYVRDGIDGLLYDPVRHGALYEAIKHLVGNPQTVRSLAANVVAPQDPTTYAARMMALYGSLLG